MADNELRSMAAMKVPAAWVPDCQGKMDYDGELVSLSTRYWPFDYGFSVSEKPEWTGTNTQPRSSATATIYLGSTKNAYYENALPLIKQDFEGETKEEVQRAVEDWASEQFRRIETALRQAFAKEPAP